MSWSFDGKDPTYTAITSGGWIINRFSQRNGRTLFSEPSADGFFHRNAYIGRSVLGPGKKYWHILLVFGPL